ncbi:MAG TPA: cell division protein FtsX [Bacteroidales bacterium]|nr:cell division protein FtsX [Bacteroidales bacterium]
MEKSLSTLKFRKFASAYTSTVISVALVLFLFGVGALLVLNAKVLSDYVKENIGFSVVLTEDAKDADVSWLQKELDAHTAVKWTKYISKEQAAEELKNDLGEDFVSFLGYNPLFASIDVRLKSDYANNDSIVSLKNYLTKYELIQEIYYQESLIDLVNKNVLKISAILLFFSLLLLISAIALINNTIRLSINSKRFLIKTMQLVGAAELYIQKPFLYTAALTGLIGGALAVLMLHLLLFTGMSELSEILVYNNIWSLSVFLILLGIVISCLGSWFAVQKYLYTEKSLLY